MSLFGISRMFSIFGGGLSSDNSESDSSERGFIELFEKTLGQTDTQDPQGPQTLSHGRLVRHMRPKNMCL